MGRARVPAVPVRKLGLLLLTYPVIDAGGLGKGVGPHVAFEAHKVVVTVLVDIGTAAAVQLARDVEVDIKTAIRAACSSSMHSGVGIDHAGALLEYAVSELAVIINSGRGCY